MSDRDDDRQRVNLLDHAYDVTRKIVSRSWNERCQRWFRDTVSGPYRTLRDRICAQGPCKSPVRGLI